MSGVGLTLCKSSRLPSSLKLTYPLKRVGRLVFLVGRPIFRGELLVVRSAKDIIWPPTKKRPSRHCSTGPSLGAVFWMREFQWTYIPLQHTTAIIKVCSVVASFLIIYWGIHRLEMIFFVSAFRHHFPFAFLRERQSSMFRWFFWRPSMKLYNGSWIDSVLQRFLQKSLSFTKECKTHMYSLERFLVAFSFQLSVGCSPSKPEVFFFQIGGIWYLL